MGNGMEELALGYRFSPTEEELLSFYLPNKLSKTREADIGRVIPEVDIYGRLDPWQLPEVAGELCVRDTEQWFFFCPLQPREAHGGRPSRTAPSGYWKATGSPGPVYSSGSRARVLGVKRSMVFYTGKAPSGRKTMWKMNEYRALEVAPGSSPKLRNEFSLCRVYKNSGSMRSFDRRPSIAATTSQVNPRSAQDHGNISGVKRTRSEISSSSDDGPKPAASLDEAFMDLKMLEDFDWNQLDWA